MAGPGSAKPAGGQQQFKKAAGVAPSAAAQKTEVLNQTRKLSGCPAKTAVGGLAIAVTIGYFTLCSKKKPEVTAIDR